MSESEPGQPSDEWNKAQLSEDERTAIILKHFQAWSISEISDRLGRPPSAIAGLLKRGLKKLRTHLQKDTE